MERAETKAGRLLVDESRRAGDEASICEMAVAARRVLAAALPTPSVAAPEEIQVYMDELNAPGEIGLDVHNNYVLSGEPSVEYEEQQQSLHRYRQTPEFSLGLTPSLELGAYLPLASIDRIGLSVDGLKFRLKWLAPRTAGQPWFWGLNLEIGRVGHRLEENPYNAELKGIAGVHSGKWTAAANVNFDFKVSGAAPALASLELATKLKYSISEKTAIGVENYTRLGKVRRLGTFGHSEQSSYAVVDTAVGRWDLNLGFGHGYGSNPTSGSSRLSLVPLNASIRVPAHI